MIPIENYLWIRNWVQTRKERERIVPKDRNKLEKWTMVVFKNLKSRFSRKEL